MYPGAIPSYAGFTSSHTLAADNHAAQSNAGQADIIALATKVGTGASTPTSGLLLRGSGTGTSAWAQAGLATDVSGVLPQVNGGTGQVSLTALPLLNPAITGTVSGGATYSSPILTTPTIADFTSATHTHANNVGGGQLNGANAITDGTITPAELTSGTGSSWAWQSYVPTVTLNGGTTNGNAVITGEYIQIGKTVQFRVGYVLGSTTDYTGLTSMFVSLPTSVSATFSANGNLIFGTGQAAISGSGYLLALGNISGSTFQLICFGSGGATLSTLAVTGSNPAVWVNGAKFYVTGTYEAA